MTMRNKIVNVYVLKGLNGISLVIENYRVSNEKIYGMLTPIYTFEVATDDILQAIGLEYNQSDDCVSREELKKWLDMNFSFGGALKKLEMFDRIDKELPPVTPTHGTCKDCKLYRPDQYKNMRCQVLDFYPNPDFYCADFEKRGSENE